MASGQGQAALSGAATGAAAGSAAGPYGALIGAGLGAVGGFLSGGGGGETFNVDASLYSPEIQRFLPDILRYKNIDPILRSGLGGIADLIRRPGMLAPNVSEAIAPRLAMESELLGRQFQGIRETAAGAGARGNVPSSMRAALDAAIQAREAGAQSQARRTALSESDVLRRQDIAQTYDLLNALLAFSSSGRGIASQGIVGMAGLAQQKQASNLAAISGLVEALGNLPSYTGKQPGPG